MKIIASNLALGSEHQREHQDLALTQSRVQSSVSRSAGITFGPDGMPLRLVDRVTVSAQEETQYQFNYRTSVSSHSEVTQSGSDDVIIHDQQSVLEEMVGGLIHTNVVISRMERGEDILLEDGDSIRPEGQDAPEDLPAAGGASWEIYLRRADIHFEQEQLSVSSTGQVVTEDGRTIDFSLDLNFDRAFVSRQESQLTIQKWQQAVNLTDPLVISLDGQAPQLSDTRFEFDLDADGAADHINFVSRGSGFLALDKNGDGRINDGFELFGPGTGNGFGELAAYDSDGNQWIDENDDVFSRLSVWTVDEMGEKTLVSLKDAGVGAISLSYAEGAFDMTSEDNSLQGQVKSSGVFLFEDGRVGAVHQVDLVSHQAGILESEKDLLNWNWPVQGAMSPLPTQGIQPVVMPESSEEPNSPLEDLREQIEKIKEEMNRLFETADWGHSKRRRRSKGIQNYQDMNGVSSFVPFGRGDTGFVPAKLYF